MVDIKHLLPVLVDVRLCKQDVRSNSQPTLLFMFNDRTVDDGQLDADFLNLFTKKEQDEFFEHFEHVCVSQKYRYRDSTLPMYMSLEHWLRGVRERLG